MKNNRISGKIEELKFLLIRYETLAVAYSGGVDSTFLLACGREVLGERIHAVIAKTPLVPGFEFESAMDFTLKAGIPCHLVYPDVMMDNRFISNTKDRCYICKRIILGSILDKAAELGISRVAHGVNVDDLSDYRPGIRAAEEMGALSPLAEAGFTKSEIREASRIMGLPTADKPAMACLASRIPYNSKVTLEKLTMIDEAESVLREAGFVQYRVRHHDTVARIELIPEDMARILSEPLRSDLIGKLKKTGFLHVALDMEGYEQGSMNRAIVFT